MTDSCLDPTPVSTSRISALTELILSPTRNQATYPVTAAKEHPPRSHHIFCPTIPLDTFLPLCAKSKTASDIHASEVQPVGPNLSRHSDPHNFLHLYYFPSPYNRTMASSFWSPFTYAPSHRFGSVPAHGLRGFVFGCHAAACGFRLYRWAGYGGSRSTRSTRRSGVSLGITCERSGSLVSATW